MSVSASVMTRYRRWVGSIRTIVASTTGTAQYVGKDHYLHEPFRQLVKKCAVKTPGFSGCNSRPESQMAIGFKTVKAALALNPKPAFRFTSAANPTLLPQPKPRATGEHFVVRSIGSRDVAGARRSGVRRCVGRGSFCLAAPRSTPALIGSLHKLSRPQQQGLRSVTPFTLVPSGALRVNAVGGGESGAIIAKKLDYALAPYIKSPAFVPFRANPEDANCRVERVDVFLHRQKL